MLFYAIIASCWLAVAAAAVTDCWGGFMAQSVHSGCVVPRKVVGKTDGGDGPR